MFRTRLVVACHDGVSFLPKWLLYEIQDERWIVMLKLLKFEMAPHGTSDHRSWPIALGGIQSVL